MLIFMSEGVSVSMVVGHIPVLIDHIRNAKPVVYDLTPTVTVEILATELTAAQVPCCAVAVCPIFEELW